MPKPRTGASIRLFLARIGLIIFFVLGLLYEASSIRAQGGQGSSANDVQVDLTLARAYEAVGDLDNAIAHYKLALSKSQTAPERETIAAEFERVLARRSSLSYQLERELSSWLVTGLKVGLALLAGFVILRVVVYVMDHRAGWAIGEFVDLASPGQETIANTISEIIVATIQEARLAYLHMRASPVMAVSEAVDLPSFAAQSFQESLIPALTSLDSLSKASIGLPIGSFLNSLMPWLSAGQKKISGSLHRDSDYRLSARLETGRPKRCTDVWQINRPKRPEGLDHSCIEDMASELAYKILFSTSRDWGAKNSTSLKLFTQGLIELQQFGAEVYSTESLKRAADLFKQALIADPSYVEAKYNLALVWINVGEARQAVDTLKELSQSTRSDFAPFVAYQLGVAYYHLFLDWAYSYAEAEFNRTIELASKQPTHVQPANQQNLLIPLAHCGLAAVEAQRVGREPAKSTEHLEQSRSHVEKALYLAGSSSEVVASARTSLALAYFNSGKCPEAIEQAANAIQAEPKFWRAYLYRGQAELGCNNITQAIASFRQATVLNPAFEFAHYQLGMALLRRNDAKLDDKEEAIHALRNAPSIANACDQLGRLLADKGLMDQALEQFRKALSANNRFTDAMADLAWYILEAGQTDPASLREAFESAKHALDIDKEGPMHWHRHMVLGRVYFTEGKLEHAEKELRESIKLSTDKPQNIYWLSRTLLAQGEPEAAQKMLVGIFALKNKGIWEERARKLMEEIKSALPKNNLPEDRGHNSSPAATPT